MSDASARIPEPAGTAPDRAARMGLVARADPAALAGLLAAIGPEPAHTFLRAPEVGSVMVRGRAGGTGAPFNLGEMTVTRCTLRLDSGEVGHAWVAGRARDHARRAALIDALMQTDRAAEVRAGVLDPLARREREARAARAAKVAATRVEFFTLVRGEDP